MQSYSVQENMTLKAAGTKRRSQVTENAIKKLDTLLGLSCLFICLFVSFPVTPGICLASTMLPVVLRVKELNIESYTLY